MTDADVIAAIQRNHLYASYYNHLRLQWSEATVDPGGTVFGNGPYVHVPAVTDDGDRVVVRVYPPERLRRKLAKHWSPKA